MKRNFFASAFTFLCWCLAWGRRHRRSTLLRNSASAGTGANLGCRHGNRHRHFPNALHGLPRKSECPAGACARRDPADASRKNLRSADHRRDETPGRDPDRRPAKNARHVSQRAAAWQPERRRRQRHAESLRVETLRSAIHLPGLNGTDGVPITSIRDSRIAKDAGLTADQVPQLKLKWAFGYPTGLSAFGQPTVVSGRIFVGSDIGYVYSLDANTGCVYWSYQAKGSVRSAVTVARGEGTRRNEIRCVFRRRPRECVRRGRAERAGTLDNARGRTLRGAHHRRAQGLRRTRVRSGVFVRGVFVLQPRLFLLHGKRKRSGARREYRQTSLEDVRGGHAGTRAEKFEGRAAVRAVGRLDLEFAHH